MAAESVLVATRRLGVRGFVLVSVVWVVLRTIGSDHAPIVRVRWDNGLPTIARRQIESEFLLVSHDGSTHTYALWDTSTRNIRRLVGHQAVRDTSDIERHAFLVSKKADASKHTRTILWKVAPRLDLWLATVLPWAIPVVVFLLALFRGAAFATDALIAPTPRDHPQPTSPQPR